MVLGSVKSVGALMSVGAWEMSQTLYVIVDGLHILVDATMKRLGLKSNQCK